MSKIVIIPGTVNDQARFISHVQRVTGSGIAEIRKRIGSHLPLGEWTLFMNDHNDTAARLRDLLTVEDRGEGSLQVFELMPDEDFSKCSREECEITPAVLRNILDSREQLSQ